jgi:hydrogenase expression/formation protein HypD
MKYIEEFRDGAVARKIAAQIAKEARASRRYRLMEFCGGHTHSLWRYGIVGMLPPEVEMIHGPGCPVCVLPIGRLEQAIALARRPEITLCTFGDMMRVPARDRKSLLKAKAEGADIRMVYGSSDALRLAKENPSREVVFFAIGFETTTPATAVVVKLAAEEGLKNFSVFCNHVLTPSAIEAILGSPEAKDGRIQVDGFVGPGHVSTIIGTAPYERFAAEHKKPVVVSGFEPLDLMQSILMLVRQLNDGRYEVENEYSRAVVRDGNAKAIALVEEVLELRPSFEWRGLGTLPDSALRLRDKYAAWDAEKKWETPYEPVADHKACACGEILRGLKKPTDCKIFGTACSPESPVGSCMVSPEGSCAAYYAYGRLLKKQPGLAAKEEVEA